MTEIPEHLLKRSRERRAALGLGGGEAPAGGDATPPAESAASEAAASSVPAPATPATPAPVEEPKPEPPRPDPPYIQAAKRRKRIPYWAMPVIAALPLWGYAYVRTLEPPPAGEDDPLVLGAEEYSACVSCHGASGGGGSGPAFVDGAVLQTWPDPRDHMAWVRLGSDGWPGATYGATNKAKAGGMPAWTSLTDAQIAQVVLHERELSGADVSEENPDNEDLYAVAHGEMTLAEAGLGPVSEAAGVTESDLGG